MERTARALSVRQPWAHLIISGVKDIENRTWFTNIRGPVLIHASGRIDMQAYHTLRLFHNLPPLHELKTKGIVGGVNIVDCVAHHKSEWFEGPFGFVLEGAQELPFRPLKGQLNFFKVDIDELYKDEPGSGEVCDAD